MNDVYVRIMEGGGLGLCEGSILTFTRRAEGKPCTNLSQRNL